MSSEWHKDLQKITEQIGWLENYAVRFCRAPSFIKYIEHIEKRLQTFQQIMLMGHCDNAFTDIVEEHYPKYRCEMKVISHRFNKGDKDDANRRGLEILADMGVAVKVNVDAHARMFIGYHELPYISELVLGSFDFNRDGLSRRKKNAGIITRNPDIVKEAVDFFNKIWEHKGSVPLREYIT